MKRSMFVPLLLLGVFPSAQAIEKKEIAARFFIVGVIATDEDQSEGRGVAVIRDHQTKRSLTMKTGEYLPYSQTWKISRIKPSEVVLSNQSEEVILEYASVAPKATKRQRPARTEEDRELPATETTKPEITEEGSRLDQERGEQIEKLRALYERNVHEDQANQNLNEQFLNVNSSENIYNFSDDDDWDHQRRDLIRDEPGRTDKTAEYAPQDDDTEEREDDSPVPPFP